MERKKVKTKVMALAICAVMLLGMSGVITVSVATQSGDDINVEGATGKIVRSGNQQIDITGIEKINPPVISVAEGSELLVNPGFETGQLPPWYTTAWVVVTDNPYSGTYCAYDVGNNWIRQDFSGVPVSEITSVTFWSRQPEEAIQAVDFFYDDGTYTEDIVYPTSTWQQFDITSWLTPGKTLTGIRIWGYCGGGPALDETYIDDISIQTVSEESSVSISTDSFEYSPGDTMTITLDIANPTEESVMFQWYWGVPQFSVWVPVMSAPIPAGYDDTHDFSFTLPNWGPTPFGNVFYVQLLDAGGEVLDADCEGWAYMQLRGAEGEVLDADCECWCKWAYMQLHDAGGDAMPAVDIGEEIKKTIEKIDN